MNTKEQLAEMARVKFSDGSHTSSADLEDEYRAVLRWFADRVNERAKEMWEEETGLVEYPSAYCTACAMTELLKELDASPAPASGLQPGRVQLRRSKGWKMPPNTVSVARPSKWGNPYRVGIDGTAYHCVKLFRKIVEENIWSEPNSESIKAQLRGKNLACWCPLNQPCHADILLEIANS